MGYELYFKYWVGLGENYAFPLEVEVAGTNSVNRVCLGAADKVWWNKVVMLGRSMT